MKANNKRRYMKIAIILVFFFILFSFFSSCENHWIIDATDHMFCKICNRPNVRCICPPDEPDKPDEPEIVLTHITASYAQTTTVYTFTPLNNLKDNLTVTAFFDDGTNRNLGAQEYTLTGTLTAPTSTITVTYGGKTDTFTVTVTVTAVTLTGITASYNQGSTIVFPNTPLDSLKSSLTVTEVYNNGATATVSASDYTLSVFGGGALTVGTNTITVSYGVQTATFTVTVTAFPSSSALLIGGVDIDLISQTGDNILERAINYINAATPGEYTLALHEDVDVTSDLQLADGVSLTLVGTVGESAITMQGTSLLFNFPSRSNVNLTIGNNITVIGLNNSSNPVIWVQGTSSNVHITMLPGSKITGHTTRNSGGAVAINGETNSFTMEGGEIIGNHNTHSTAANNPSGGVFIVNGATFTMNGGTITGNTREIGGVTEPMDVVIMADAGSFTHNGGTIGTLLDLR